MTLNTAARGRNKSSTSIVLRVKRKLGANIALATQARLIVRDRKDNRYFLSLDFVNVDQYEATIAGQRYGMASGLAGQITTGRAILEVTDLGDVLAVHLNPNDPELFRTTAQLFAQEFQVHLAETRVASWSADETSSHGVSKSRYRIHRQSKRGHQLTKHRGRYVSLRGVPWLSAEDLKHQRLEFDGQIDLAVQGHIQRIAFREQLVVGPVDQPMLTVQTDASLSLARITKETVRPFALSGYEPIGLGDMIWSEAAARAALVSRADGLTWKNVESGILGVGNFGRSHAKWRWRTTGLLRLHPELCYKFIDLFEHEHINDDGRVLIMELLGSTGHAEAQDVMGQLLTSETASDQEVTYARLVQTLSKVRAPNTDTAQFIGQAFLGAKGIGKVAAGYALSSVVSRLTKPAHQQLRQELSDHLIGGYRNAQSDDVRGPLLLAIGATQLPENLDIVAQEIETSSAFVRSRAAAGLRFAAAGEKRDQLLLDLATDRDRQVQKSALVALENQPLDQTQYETIAQQILNGSIYPNSYYQSLDIVQRIENHDLRATTLSHMLNNAPDDAQFRARIQKAQRSL